ncbi:MAG: hypothetical protein LC109_03000 [Bacteroidia bacterium]|nr:hypothetical protein [Bacteroidia bacterium]
MSHRITFYKSNTHPIYGGHQINHDSPFVKVDPRPIMKVKPSKDVHKLVSECEAEIQSNSISVRHLFSKKPSRRERKNSHRK